MRETDLAIPTWDIAGDFFLFVQDTHQDARQFNEQQKIIKDIEPFSDKFKAICIVDKIKSPDVFSSTLHNQIWKWKVAYNFLKPYIDAEGYDRFIIIRPDSYLRIFRNLDELYISPNTCYSTSEIIIDTNGFKFANDTWMAFDSEVFKLLSNFYDYVLLNNIGSVHGGLANYFELHNIKVTNDLIMFGETFQLRPEVRYMFEGNIRRDKYSYNDVAQELIAWNRQPKSTYLKD
jgi:hypothetical protein